MHHLPAHSVPLSPTHTCYCFCITAAQRIFSKLLAKIRRQTDALDRTGEGGAKAAELNAVKPIVEKVRVQGCGEACCTGFA